jgi:hypothetical protein
MQRDNSVKSRRRWRRQQLADFWGVSTRTVDRRRKQLGDPKYVCRIPTWSDAQRKRAERDQPYAPSAA